MASRKLNNTFASAKDAMEERYKDARSTFGKERERACDEMIEWVASAMGRKRMKVKRKVGKAKSIKCAIVEGTHGKKGSEISL